MIRKTVCALFAAALLMAAGAKAEAAEQLGSIQVSLDLGELPALHGSMTLYRVGDRTEEGYRITEAFGGGIVRDPDARSVHLARWLAESAGDGGKTIYLDVDGNVTFSHLEEGLYLVLQTERTDGFYPIKPALITLPDENQWEAKLFVAPDPIILDNPQTGQQPWPFLGALGMAGSGMGLYFCLDNKRKK